MNKKAERYDFLNKERAKKRRILSKLQNCCDDSYDEPAPKVFCKEKKDVEQMNEELCENMARNV